MSFLCQLSSYNVNIKYKVPLGEELSTIHLVATYSAALEFSCDRRLVLAQFSCRNDSK